MDGKAKIIAINPIRAIHCGSPYKPDRPRRHIGALDHGKWAWRGAGSPGVGASMSVDLGQTAPTSDDSRVNGAERAI